MDTVWSWWQGVYMFGCFLIMSQLFRDTQREILRKRPKNNKAWINLSEKILSILGDCWEKFICSSLPARLMEKFPASKVHLQPATWLTRKFPSRRMSTHYTLNCPRDTFLPRTYYFFQISQPAKMCLKNRYFEEEFWGRGPLGAPDF